MDWIVIAALCVWLALSLVAQLRPRSPRNRRLGLLALMPVWGLPLPNREQHILFRDKLIDSAITDWHPIVFPERPFAKALWNPESRRRKAVVAMCTHVLDHTDSAAKQFTLSSSYFSLAEFVSRNAHSPSGVFTQFMIEDRTGEPGAGTAREQFVSPLYRL